MSLLLKRKGIVLNFPLMLCLWVMVFLLYLWIFPIHFETNDDIVMLLISSGAYSGTPDFHLVFINVIYGFLVQFLYTLLPAFEWYTILFCVLQIISFSIVLWVYAKRVKTLLGQLLILLLLLVLQARFLIGMQFTTTAAIIACAGLSLYFTHLKWMKALGLFLFFMGSLIRFEAAILCLGVYAPVMMFPLSGRMRSKRQFGQAALGLLIILILPITAKVVDRSIYAQDPDWQYYIDYNRIRGVLNDNPNVVRLYSDKSLSAVANSNDLVNMINFIPDITVLDLKTIAKVSHIIGSSPVEDKLENVGEWLLFYWDSILLLFVILSLLFAERKVSYRWSLFFVGLLFIALLSYVSLNATVKERVFLSAVTPLMLVLGLVIANYLHNRLKISLLSFLYLLVLVTITRQTVDMYKKKLVQEQVVSEQLSLMRLVDNSYITPFGASFFFEGLPSFQVTSIIKSLKSKLIITGWMTGIPLNHGLMNSHLDLVDIPIWIFAYKNNAKEIRNIQYCLEKNYRIKTKCETVAENGEFEIVSFKQIVK